MSCDKSNLIKENNDPEFIKELFINGVISGQEYHFRLKANELGIETYSII